MTRKSTLALFLFFIVLQAIVLANPKPSPQRVAGSIVVLATAFFVEIAITTGYLALLGIRAGPIFAALFLINLLTYTLIFIPGLAMGIPLLLMELFIVLIEGAFIKVLSSFLFFQGDTFDGLKWRHAILASVIGNAFSYGVGEMVRP